MKKLLVCTAALVIGALSACSGSTSTGGSTIGTLGGATSTGRGGTTSAFGGATFGGATVGNGGTTATSGGSTVASGGATAASGGATAAAGTGTTFAGAFSSDDNGVTSTCIAGTKGCLCDSVGACRSGLTCTPQTSPLPARCCAGTDCAGTGVSVGASCGATTGPATCTPGITLPAAANGNDTCGYPETSFNENVILCAITAAGGGSQPAQIRAFYNDEHALTLGCATDAFPVSALSRNPDATLYPETGDPTCVDTSNRPLRPVLFITDLTADPNCTVGDQQKGGKAYDPVAIFGTWKSATMSNGVGTPNQADPSPYNRWDLSPLADTVPPEATNTCPCTAQSCVTTGHTGRGYGAEVRFEAGLIAGHSYRLQVQMHDGDQTQGADAGEACATFCAGSGACTPKTCADYPDGTCGQQPDGCGGLTPSCAECCTPTTCEDLCANPTDPTKASCQSNYDEAGGWVGECPQDDKCGGKLQCWCQIG